MSPLPTFTPPENPPKARMLRTSAWVRPSNTFTSDVATAVPVTASSTPSRFTSANATLTGPR